MGCSRRKHLQQREAVRLFSGAPSRRSKRVGRNDHAYFQQSHFSDAKSVACCPQKRERKNKVLFFWSYSLLDRKTRSSPSCPSTLDPVWKISVLDLHTVEKIWMRHSLCTALFAEQYLSKSIYFNIFFRKNPEMI